MYVLIYPRSFSLWQSQYVPPVSQVMSEILWGIRVIKFYAWEKHFSQKVGRLREAELQSLKGRKYLDAWCVFFWACTPALISTLTFTTYVLLGNQLTAAKVRAASISKHERA